MNTSLLGKKWKIKTEWSKKSLIERIYQQRDESLSNELKELHSPWSLKDIKKAVERVSKAIKNQERIMIFGDYDVDGVSGASILYLGLQELGAQISVRLPHREKDGYGLNTKVLDECASLGVSLLITVDCGISNVAEVEHGNALGLDIIVTDHHSIPPQLPKAYAILNPKQQDCEYPDKEICGSVVGFKLIAAMAETVPEKKVDIQRYIDMAALATVADCMPLVGENRLIVKKGLLQMKQTRHRGLRTLLESYELLSDPKPLNSYDLGFKIAPCINAAGRLDDPLIAFKMMMGDEQKALELRHINQERQDVVKYALEDVLEQAQEYKDRSIIIVWSEEWQPGIIGLLAGRLCEKFNKPSICLTLTDGKYVGSCRSIPQINIVEHLQELEHYFLNYGGHAQAAGLSIEPTKLEEFTKKMEERIQDFVKENPIEPTLSIDTELKSSEITMENYQLLESLQPFGMGNPKPKFALKNVQLESSRPVGRDQNHLQTSFVTSEGHFFKGIGFNMAEYQSQIEQWKHLDLVCQLNKNTFRGQTTIDLQLVDAKPHQS